MISPLRYVAATFIAGAFALPCSAASESRANARSNEGIVRPPDADSVGRLCLVLAHGLADAESVNLLKRLERTGEALVRKSEDVTRNVQVLREWMARREAAMSKASEAVVTIYGRMKPEAAAAQIASMDEDVAIAILDKLNAKSASAILNEMDSQIAARMAGRLARGIAPGEARQ